jgi:release factor glutamine methyltransferase
VSSRTWTIREVLEWATGDFRARGIESPRLDAELIVAKALGVDRIALYLDLNRPLLESERKAIRPLVARRREREPVAYILGHRDFFGRRFRVTRDVLIPRPDTETLVERALALIPRDQACRIADVGTGSGAIAVTLAAELPLATITATDISEAALQVASENAKALGIGDRIRFQHADLLAGDEQYDFIVSNPPYVAKGELETLQAEVRSYEPEAALVAGEDGLETIRALLEAAEAATSSGAHVLVEVGAGQAPRALEIVHGSPWRVEAVYPDLNRVERVVHLRRT